jgi:hypothetical protein
VPEKNGRIRVTSRGPEKPRALSRIVVGLFRAQTRYFFAKTTGREKNPDWLAEGVGFEPTRPFWGLTVFKTAGFNHSPTPPVLIIEYLPIALGTNLSLS